MKTISVLLASSAFAFPTFESIATNLGSMNIGSMTAMQTDMTATGTDCYAAASSTADAITALGTASEYTNGSYNPSDFFNLAQVAAIQLMD